MLRRFTAYISLLSLVLVTLVPVTAFAASVNQGQNHSTRRASSKVAPELTTAGTSSQTVRVIIQTKGRPTSAQDNALTSAGGRKRHSFELLDMLVADVPANAVATLAARNDVAYVSPDRPVKSEASNRTNEAPGAAQVQRGLAGMPG